MDINLAKWKRWSREFLPPDPLGGLQSGYARQYNPNQAFVVYLGGILVSTLKYSIPEAKKILEDLDDWMAGSGFNYDFSGNSSSQKIDPPIQRYIVYITRKKLPMPHIIEFSYSIRGILSTQSRLLNGLQVMEERYVETKIGHDDRTPAIEDVDDVKTLYITNHLKNFIRCLELEPIFYPVFATV